MTHRPDPNNQVFYLPKHVLGANRPVIYSWNPVLLPIKHMLLAVKHVLLLRNPLPEAQKHGADRFSHGLMPRSPTICLRSAATEAVYSVTAVRFKAAQMPILNAIQHHHPLLIH